MPILNVDSSAEGLMTIGGNLSLSSTTYSFTGTTPPDNYWLSQFNLDIPKNSIINGFQFVVRGASTSVGAGQFSIGLENSPNPSALVNGEGDGTRTLLTDTAYLISVGGIVDGGEYTLTPESYSLFRGWIQDLINHASWASGNRFIFRVFGNGAGKTASFSFRTRNFATTPRGISLIIDYTPPAQVPRYGSQKLMIGVSL